MRQINITSFVLSIFVLIFHLAIGLLFDLTCKILYVLNDIIKYQLALSI